MAIAYCTLYISPSLLYWPGNARPESSIIGPSLRRPTLLEGHANKCKYVVGGSM